METEVRYYPIKAEMVSAAKDLFEQLDAQGTSQHQLLVKVMAIAGATACTFGAVKFGGKPRMRIAIQAPNPQQVLVNFKSSNDPDPAGLRRLLNKVLVTKLEDEPCPVALT